MPWFRIDDDATFHPKVVAAGNDGFGVFVRMGSWTMKHLTDGRIPTDIAVLVAGSKRLLDKIVRAGLLDTCDGGYQIHDHLDRNPSAEDVRLKAATRAAAGQAGGKQSGKTRRSKSEAKREANASSNTEANGEAKTNPNPNPLEKHPPARVRVMEPANPIVDAWSRITGNLMANSQDMADMVDLLRRAGAEEACDPADYITAFVEWAKDCPPGRQPQRAPRKLIENFAAVQEWRRGERRPTDKTIRDSESRPRPKPYVAGRYEEP